ncbi:MAG: aminodeoxychorismate/anthranilate synthase component II [Candidatus Omnitrophica bacterium]|nr:aminodeoxychorismate/anthranilate synthase component II [Candidatus Omnitrophota bacterium]
MKKRKILMIDNYDSFTYNLVQYFGELGEDMAVVRNDQIGIEQIKKLHPARIVISPGPGNPQSAGVSCEVIKQFYRDIPILGVCLGHQCIGSVFGARIVKAPSIMHGKTSLIYHNGHTIFKGLPSPFEATRYHSLIVDNHSLSANLEVNAHTEDGIIMGIREKVYPLYGVQFHPESILTGEGKKLLKNFLRL